MDQKPLPPAIYTTGKAHPHDAEENEHPKIRFHLTFEGVHSWVGEGVTLGGEIMAGLQEWL